jgi:peptide/nickel transport system ATP-binding protein
VWAEGPAATPVEPLLCTSGLRIQFNQRGGLLSAVEEVSFEISAGQTLAIIGASGAGKSLSCRALMGLLPPSAIVNGSVRFEGNELIGLDERSLRAHRGTNIAMVFQDAERSLNPTIPVGQQIGEAISLHERVPRKAARDRALELMRSLKLSAPHRTYHAYPHELSGGMRQRVMIAIAVARKPKLLIADEPTSSLDVTTQSSVMSLLVALQREFHMALLFVSHNLRLAAAFADSLLVMQSGRAVAYGATAELIGNSRVPYVRALLDATPASDQMKSAAESRATWSARSLPATAPLLVATDLVQEFQANGNGSRGGVLRALSGVSLEIRAGETLALVGETGSGKSTLARALLQIPPPTSGSVLFRGRDLTRLRGRELFEHRRHIQIIFQDPFSSMNPKWRVTEIIEEPLVGQKIGSTERRNRVSALIELVGLPAGASSCKPKQLSGGQCQRVAVARALVSEPELVICDEALSSLDVLTQRLVLDLFERLREKLGIAWLFISHDLPLVSTISDRLAVLHLGQLCEIGSTHLVYRRPRHPYTASLLESLAALPSKSAELIRPRDAEATALDGLGAQAGCRFRAKCVRAQETCTSITPQLRSVGVDHLVACHFPLP